VPQLTPRWSADHAHDLFVEPPGSVGGRIVASRVVGALLALGSLHHVSVVTLDLVFGIRYGAHYDWLCVLLNCAVATAGNLIGGLLFVTLTRTGQAPGSGASAHRAKAETAQTAERRPKDG